MSDAYRGGEIAGALIGTALLLLGAAWCAVIARRRTTSAACVYSLGLVLLGWATMAVPRTAATLSPGLELPAPVFYLPGLALMAAGAIAAVAGLVLYSRNRAYVQGRRQAIAALGIVSVVGLAFTVGLAWRAAQLIKERRTGVVEGASPAAPIVRQDLNFSFTPPPRPWVTWDATKVNPAVTFGLMRTRHQSFFMVVAERGLDDVDTAGLVSIAQANIKSSSDAQISGETVHRVADMDGTRFYAEVQKGQYPLTYVFWVFARGGFGYQLITFGRQSDRAAIRRDADDLVSRFRQMDSARTAVAAKPEPLGAYRSEDLGLAADLSGSGWFEWRALAESNPEGALGGLREDGGGFLVAPLVFEGPAPPRLPAVTRAVLKEWEIEYPSAAVTEGRAFERWGLRGHRLEHARTVDEVDYDYRFTVMAGQGHGVFVAVWAHRGERVLEEWARSLESRLRVAAPRLTAEQLPAPMRAYQARVHNRLGLAAYQARDYRQATPLFQAAARLDGTDPTYLTNVLDSFGRAERWKEGLEYLRSVDHPARQHDEVRSWEAWMLKESGRRDEALAIYGPLFAGSFRGDEDFEAYGALLAAAGRFDDLQRAYDRYLRGKDSAKLRRGQARLLGQAGRDADALAVLDRVRPPSGFDAELAWARMTHLRALDRHRERIAVCEELIKNGFASYDAYYEKADAETSLHWYQRAKASLEEALKHRPGDEDAKDYLQHVSGLLGEGNNSAVKDAVEPVPLPAVLTSRLAGPTPTGEGTRYVHWVDGFAFRKGQDARATTRRRIVVADQAGVERFSTMEVDFDPLFEAVYVNELTVRDAQGGVVARGQPSDSYVVDKQDDLATHDKTLFVPVPGLAVGHTIDFTVTRRERASPQAFGYRALRMGSDLAVGLRAAYYLGDTKAIRHKASGAQKSEIVPGGLLWKLENVPPQPSEPLQPRSERALLWLGDAGADWSALGREYLASIEPKLAPASATEALARRLMKGRAERQQIVDAVAAHVHHDYVYKALEFGRRGRIPNAPPATIRAKFGDCKDHAVLMQALLRVAGVASHLALVSTGDDVQVELPSLDQFNHMVLFVPAAAGAPARFYDATDKGLDPRLSPPLGLASRSALVLDPAQPRFERIAPYASHSSRVRVERGVRLGEAELAVTEKVEISGYFSASLRDHLVTLDARGRREWGQRVVSGAARGARVSSLAVANVGDVSKPLVVDAAYNVQQQCSADGTGLRCPLATPWETYYLEADPVADRRTPFELTYPLELSSSTTVRGDGCRSLAWEGRPAGGKAEFATWSAKDSVQERSASLALDLELTPGTFAASRYDEYVRQMDLAIRSVARTVTCVK